MHKALITLIVLLLGISSAAWAAAIAARGAGVAGCPTSMWMTWPPLASIRSAAAITSITMNGGTLLRADGAVRLAIRCSNVGITVASTIDICY